MPLEATAYPKTETTTYDDIISRFSRFVNSFCEISLKIFDFYYLLYRKIFIVRHIATKSDKIPMVSQNQIHTYTVVL